MVKTKRRIASTKDSDLTYLLKLILYLIIGAQWLWLDHASSRLPIPVGLFLGLIFTSHEHFKIDRKIEYAVLAVAMLVGFWAQAGLNLSI